ncbi:MAG: Rrf2 family transcriptional regulator [Candidatus Omnitrophica bacterium]|nr:Rrf2 family transcriptional regulator [Candidatus Omnitrophota bacterium]
MKLSTRSTYGMRALVELGLTVGRGPLSAAQIAERQGLSVAYLEQLLHRLKKQGLVISVRGPKGGYLLAKEPEQITVAEIVRILDGDGMWRNGNGKGKDGHRHAQRIAQAVFRCVHERLEDSLDHVTLKDLCDEVRELAGEPLEHRYVFHI